ncbi:MAG: peptide chain release factor N(5)-glutamine methyltransferase [Bacteroidales bacterium]|jgi:release factor glutamine methyltransferase|nr:peptide chain release factor N(5)-glutamine methyltransferase [Bacteroidales bacterium]
MQIQSNKIQDIFSFAQKYLAKIYNEKEINEFIYILLENYSSLDKTQVLAYKERGILESELLKIVFAIKDLKKEKPIQYIIGKTKFYGLDLLLNHNVLIPRAETEELVDIIIKENKEKSGLIIADLCSGSGCIALALKKNLKNSRLFAYDIDDNSIIQIKENAENLNLDIVIEKKDLLKDISSNEKFDIIVSNPPYVMEKEKALMQNNVLKYEPEKAIFVKDDNPLIFYKSIYLFSQKFLKENGKIFLEINEALSKETANIFKEYKTKIIKDIFDKDRFLVVEK